MIPYLLYYFIGLSIFFFNKKWIPISFSLLWFVFVGFRDAIGTDYYSTLGAIQRSYIDFENPALSFYSYNLVDLELSFKLIATVIHYCSNKVEYAYILIGFIEALIIFLILKKVKHKQIFLVYFLTMFTLNYPMNAIRQGFSLLILIFGLNYFSTGAYIKRNITIVFSCLSHYASIPIIVLSGISFKNKIVSIIALLLVVALFYTFGEMIILRWPTEDITSYKFQGYGVKLIIQTLLILSINYFIVERKIFTQENVLLIALMIATYIYNPFIRLNTFYTFVVVFSDLFKIDNKILRKKNILLLFSIPFFTFFSEWLEISRFVPVSGLGHWLPYKSLLF